jgi:thiamine-monophosphate kinase
MNSMEETDIIRLFLGALPPDPRRINSFFSADAEILEIDGGRILFTIDSFDAEDHFRVDDPYLLGWNIAACTVSDIFACGGRVVYFGHSATVSEEWDAAFISAMSQGIADVMRECGGRFAGGDLGCSSRWHYTGVAIGRSERAVTRQGAQAGDVLYFSGEVGAGNFEAATALLDVDSEMGRIMSATRVRFPLRHREARLVSRHARACIDTSDGLLRALSILAERNHKGYICETIPYFHPGLVLMENMGLPLELLMAGECGEYELLSCISPENEAAFLADAGREGLRFHRIGTIAEEGTAVLHGGGRSLDLGDHRLCARMFPDHRDYVRELTRYFLAKYPTE